MKIVHAITELEIHVNDISNQICFSSQCNAHQMNLYKILKQYIDYQGNHYELIPFVIYQENIKTNVTSQSCLNFCNSLRKYH